jgi:hypothetical protein
VDFLAELANFSRWVDVPYVVGGDFDIIRIVLE